MYGKNRNQKIYPSLRHMEQSGRAQEEERGYPEVHTYHVNDEDYCDDYHQDMVHERRRGQEMNGYQGDCYQGQPGNQMAEYQGPGYERLQVMFIGLNKYYYPGENIALKFEVTDARGQPVKVDCYISLYRADYDNAMDYLFTDKFAHDGPDYGYVTIPASKLPSNGGDCVVAWQNKKKDRNTRMPVPPVLSPKFFIVGEKRLPMNQKKPLKKLNTDGMFMKLFNQRENNKENKIKPLNANFENVDPVSSRFQELTEEEKIEYLKKTEEEEKKIGKKQEPLKISHWNKFFESQLSEQINVKFEKSKVGAAHKMITDVVNILMHFPENAYMNELYALIDYIVCGDLDLEESKRIVKFMLTCCKCWVEEVQKIYKRLPWGEGKVDELEVLDMVAKYLNAPQNKEELEAKKKGAEIDYFDSYEVVDPDEYIENNLKEIKRLNEINNASVVPNHMTQECAVYNPATAENNMRVEEMKNNYMSNIHPEDLKQLVDDTIEYELGGVFNEIMPKCDNQTLVIMNIVKNKGQQKAKDTFSKHQDEFIEKSKAQVQNSAPGVVVMSLNEDDEIEFKEENSALRDAYNQLIKKDCKSYFNYNDEDSSDEDVYQKRAHGEMSWKDFQLKKLPKLIKDGVKNGSMCGVKGLKKLVKKHSKKAAANVINYINVYNFYSMPMNKNAQQTSYQQNASNDFVKPMTSAIQFAERRRRRKHASSGSSSTTSREIKKAFDGCYDDLKDFLQTEIKGLLKEALNEVDVKVEKQKQIRKKMIKEKVEESKSSSSESESDSSDDSDEEIKKKAPARKTIKKKVAKKEETIQQMVRQRAEEQAHREWEQLYKQEGERLAQEEALRKKLAKGMNDMELKVRRELKERKRKEAENSELKYKLEMKDEEMELKNEEHNRDLEKLGDALTVLQLKKSMAEKEKRERMKKEAENHTLKMELDKKKDAMEQQEKEHQKDLDDLGEALRKLQMKKMGMGEDTYQGEDSYNMKNIGMGEDNYKGMGEDNYKKNMMGMVEDDYQNANSADEFDVFPAEKNKEFGVCMSRQQYPDTPYESSDDEEYESYWMKCFHARLDAEHTKKQMEENYLKRVMAHQEKIEELEIAFVNGMSRAHFEAEQAAEKAAYEKYQVESNKGVEKLEAQIRMLAEKMDEMEADGV